MSDRQNLAEHGTGLCLWAIGAAASTNPLVGVAVVGMAFLDIYTKCRSGRTRAAMAKAVKALEDTGIPERGIAAIPERGITAALALIRGMKVKITVDRASLMDAQNRKDFPNTLYDTVFGKLPVPADDRVADALRLVTAAAWAELRLEDDVHKLLTQESLLAIEAMMAERLDAIKDDTAATRADVAEMKALLLQALQSNQPQTYADHTKMIIGLAQNYASNPDGTPITDFDTAYRGLENALQVAEDLRAQNALPRNAADQVDAVLAAVQALNDAAEFDRADAALAAARAEAADRIAEQTSGLMRLWDSTVAQATLRNRPEQAATALVERLLLDAPADRFESMRALRREWYERGRDKGLAFDATVAIHLAEQALALAQTVDQRGAAQNDLGLALQTLGEREPGTARLDAAVAAYSAALKEFTRDRVPLDWAMTQNNLGNALQTLGQREPGTVRLDAAVAAYTEALKEYTQDRVPLQWATTQNNLGNALATLGQREPGTARLDAAVAAYTEALKEQTRDRVPLDWAMTQNNLGIALRTLGEREPGTARLDAAVAAYTAALKEYTQLRVPLDWAATQNNLGAALQTLGEREPGTARLDAAVAAYTEALKERTRDRVPLDWASTQHNLSSVEVAFFNKTADPAHLDRAEAHVRAALEVFTEAGAGQYVGMAEGNLAAIAALRP